MQPFQELVKSKITFYWDSTLDNIFKESKNILLSKVKDSICSFDIKHKTGISYILLQKYCNCDVSNVPVCCTDGWRVVYAGSRFTNPAESRYSPTEGEALALTWSIGHAKNTSFLVAKT